MSASGTTLRISLSGTKTASTPATSAIVRLAKIRRARNITAAMVARPVMPTSTRGVAIRSSSILRTRPVRIRGSGGHSDGAIAFANVRLCASSVRSLSSDEME